MAKHETQKSLSSWTKEEWGTKSGKNSTQGKKATGERYLPKKARESLSDEEYNRTSAKKSGELNPARTPNELLCVKVNNIVSSLKILPKKPQGIADRSRLNQVTTKQ